MIDIDNILAKHKDKLIDNLKTLVSFNSVVSKQEPDAPFGSINKACLLKALEIAKEDYGLEVKNLDSYCGFAQIGHGKDIIGIVTHLDVVPAGNGWTTPPFEATIKNNKIYGRGTSDDKGATVACMLALHIIKKANIPLHKRIRLIMGCAEEVGALDMKYYLQKEKDFTIGFTPDGNFPCVHGEKGHITAVFNVYQTHILDISGGTATNACADKCTIKVVNNSFDKHKLKEFLKERQLTVEIKEQEDGTIIHTTGLGSHASTPELGKNAITFLMHGLKYAQFNDYFVDYYCSHFNLNSDGKLLGMACKDKYGTLTCVNGTIEMKQNNISFSVDIRVPVTFNTEEKITKLLSNQTDKVKIEIINFEKSLYFDPEQPIVNKLLTAYQTVSKDYDSKPLVLGGGTYAKSFHNCIAYGCSFPKENNHIHEADEFVSIDELLLQVKFYIAGILALLDIN